MPYLIISNKDILFQAESAHEQMQRLSFSSIKKASITHRYGPSQELFVWLTLYTHQKTSPYLIQLTCLQEPLEEVISILQEELGEKLKISLPKPSTLKRLQTGFAMQKRLGLLTLFLLIFLFAYHKLNIPSTTALETSSTKLVSTKAKGICSANIKLATSENNQESVEVKEYCAILGFWRLRQSKAVPLKFLETEFSDKSANDYLIESKRVLQNKAYQEAIVTLEQALYLEPHNALAQVALSQAYYQNSQYHKALELAKQSILEHPKMALAHQNISQLYQNKDRIKQAYKHLLEANRLNPTASTYLLLAELEEKEGFGEKAIEHYEKYLVLKPESGYALTNLGMLYWQHYAFEKAHKTLKKAYELEPDDAGSFLNYYEIALVSEDDINATLKEHFLSLANGNKEDLMTFDMLNIIQDTLANKNTEEAKALWLQNYQNHKLNWSFKEIRSWLDESDLELERKQELQATIGFFIGYQQKYNLEHPEAMRMEFE